MAKVLITEKLSDTGLELLRARGHDVQVQLDLSPMELRSSIADFDALIIRSATEVDAELLDAAKQLQVVGRAGRRSKPGLAIVQTYNPEDVYIKTASTMDTHKFYNIALAQRQELNYPPFSRIGRILFTGKSKLTVEHLAQKTGNKLQGNPNYKILGPTSAPIEKIQGNWRAHLIIKTKDRNVSSIHQFLYSTIGFSIFERKWKGVRIQVDVDPISLL